MNILIFSPNTLNTKINMEFETARSKMRYLQENYEQFLHSVWQTQLASVIGGALP